MHAAGRINLTLYGEIHTCTIININVYFKDTIYHNFSSVYKFNSVSEKHDQWIWCW